MGRREAESLNLPSRSAPRPHSPSSQLASLAAERDSNPATGAVAVP